MATMISLYAWGLFCIGLAGTTISDNAERERENNAAWGLIGLGLMIAGTIVGANQ